MDGMESATNATPERRLSAPDWAPRFLASLRETANIRASAEAAGVDRTTAYRRRDSDPAFAAAMAAALDDAVDSLELEARRRAYHGVRKPVIYQGEVSGVWLDEAGRRVSHDAPGARFVPLTLVEYSDTLMIFLLKAHRPEKYRENSRVEVGGVPGSPVEMKHEHDIAADLRPYLAVVASFLGGAPAEAVPPDGTTQPVGAGPPLAEASDVPPA